jgi:transcriptional regulator with XRE-family HTH domain
MTQTSLARAVGVSYQQVQKYETAKDRVSASMFYRFAKALEMPISEFFPDA